MHALAIVRLLDAALARGLHGFERVHGLVSGAERAPDSAQNTALSSLLCEIAAVVNDVRAQTGDAAAESVAIEIPPDLRHPDELERIEIGLPDLQGLLFGSDGFGDIDLGSAHAAARARELCEQAQYEITDFRAALGNVAVRVAETLNGLAARRRPTAPERNARALQAGLRNASRIALRAQSKLSARAVMLLETR